MSALDGLVIGVDLGTSMVKAGLYTFDGSAVALQRLLEEAQSR